MISTMQPSGSSNQGVKLSLRGFQKAFKQHAAANGHVGLTWRQYRSNVLRQPHIYHIGLDRGAVVAARHAN